MRTRDHLGPCRRVAAAGPETWRQLGIDGRSSTCHDDSVPETTTTTAGSSGSKEAPVATFQVSCPCGCGEAVEALDAGFAATSVEVKACSKWAANGITSSRLRKSWALQNAVPVAVLSHRDGLVAFS